MSPGVFSSWRSRLIEHLDGVLVGSARQQRGEGVACHDRPVRGDQGPEQHESRRGERDAADGQVDDGAAELEHAMHAC